MKITLIHSILRWISAILFIGLSACTRYPSPYGPEPPWPSPSPTIPLSSSRVVSLFFPSIREASQAPVYTIAYVTPVLTGNDPQAVRFNQQVSGLVQKQIDDFKQGMQGMPNPPVAMESYFDLHPTLVSVAGDILSLKLVVDAYADGAAHPYQYSVTFNYDLGRGQELTLDRLFLPGSPYLETIANYCKAELMTRDIAFEDSSQGADPTPENYRNWNITSDGLLITFDEYQVAAYAAGPQTVVLPFKELGEIIDPQGSLAEFRP